MNTKAPSSRAPKIPNSTPTPIRLSAAELKQANIHAASQERSRSAFMRSMYLRGLKELEKDLKKNR